MFIINDHSDGRTYECEDRFDLEEKLGEIFDTDEEGVSESIDFISRNAGREYTGDHEAFLNIDVMIVK